MLNSSGPGQIAHGDPVGISGNFYSSGDFLDLVSKIYFPGKVSRPEIFRVQGRDFRLLTVEGHGPIADAPFLDVHEDLPGGQGEAAVGTLARLDRACLGIVGVDEFRNDSKWKESNGAPFVSWGQFGSWDEYLEILRARRVLAEDQRRRRRLEESLGVLEFTADDARDDVLPTCYAWKSLRDREALRTDASRADLFARSENREFFPELRSRGLLRASTLRAGGQLLAVWLGTVHEGRWSGWVFAFNPDPALSKFSLGRQLLHPMLAESYRSGHREFDFSLGLEQYKFFFATHVRVIGLLGSPAVTRRIMGVARNLLRRHRGLHSLAKRLRLRFSRRNRNHS